MWWCFLYTGAFLPCYFLITTRVSTVTDMNDIIEILYRDRLLPNGFLLQGDLHSDFDKYLWLVNPDVSNDLRPECFRKAQMQNKILIQLWFSVSIWTDWAEKFWTQYVGIQRIFTGCHRVRRAVTVAFPTECSGEYLCVRKGTNF